MRRDEAEAEANARSLMASGDPQIAELGRRLQRLLASARRQPHTRRERRRGYRTSS